MEVQLGLQSKKLFRGRGRQTKEKKEERKGERREGGGKRGRKRKKKSLRDDEDVRGRNIQRLVEVSWRIW